MSLPSFLRAVLVASTAFAVTVAMAADPLHIEVYNPGKKSLFPVSSELVTGRTEAVLIDAQLQRNDAEVLVEKIKATGNRPCTSRFCAKTLMVSPPEVRTSYWVLTPRKLAASTTPST